MEVRVRATCATSSGAVCAVQASAIAEACPCRSSTWLRGSCSCRLRVRVRVRLGVTVKDRVRVRVYRVRVKVRVRVPGAHQMRNNAAPGVECLAGLLADELVVGPPRANAHAREVVGVRQARILHRDPSHGRLRWNKG